MEGGEGREAEGRGREERRDKERSPSKQCS